MASAALPPPPSPEEATNFLTALKDFIIPGAVGIGSAVVGWMTAIVNMRNSQADAVTKQLQALMAGYQEQVKLMQAGYESRLKDLRDQLTYAFMQVDDLRKALDKRPACENCATRAKLEEQIKNVIADYEAEKAKNTALHVQHMPANLEEGDA